MWIGVPALKLKCRFSLYATFGVSSEDQPLIESCCEVVPSDALNPRVNGTIPAGPLSLAVTAALRIANSSSSAWGAPCTPARRAPACGAACALARIAGAVIRTRIAEMDESRARFAREIDTDRSSIFPLSTTAPRSEYTARDTAGQCNPRADESAGCRRAVR